MMFHWLLWTNLFYHTLDIRFYLSLCVHLTLHFADLRQLQMQGQGPIFTKMVIQYFLQVEKWWNSAQMNLSSTYKFLPKKNIFHIHQEIDQWNRRRFGAKWKVTVPNSVSPIKPIICKRIYMSEGWYFQMTRELHVSKIFVELWFWEIFIKIMMKNVFFTV